MTARSAAVVGAGAMGGVWAARLGLAGLSVGVVDVSRDLVEAIGAYGVTLEPEDGGAPRTARVDAVTDPAELGPRDLVFVFVKGPHTAAAGQALGPLIASHTTVVSLQNGWGNGDVLARHVPPDQLVVGVTYEGAAIRGPGLVANNGHGPTYLGPYLDGGDLARAELVADAMRLAAFDVIVTGSVRTDIWRKLVHNASCLAIAALTGLRTAELVEPGPVRDLLDAVARETVEVARALGHDIDAEERVGRIHNVLAAAGLGVPSMLADARARRVTEIHQINGAVVDAAAPLGLPVPLNRALVALVEGLERGWTRTDGG